MKDNLTSNLHAIREITGMGPRVFVRALQRAGVYDNDSRMRPEWGAMLESDLFSERDAEIVASELRIGGLIFLPDGDINEALAKRKAIEQQIEDLDAERKRIRRQIVALKLRMEAVDSELLARRIAREEFEIQQTPF